MTTLAVSAHTRSITTALNPKLLGNEGLAVVFQPQGSFIERILAFYVYGGPLALRKAMVAGLLMEIERGTMAC